MEFATRAAFTHAQWKECAGKPSSNGPFDGKHANANALREFKLGGRQINQWAMGTRIVLAHKLLLYKLKEKNQQKQNRQTDREIQCLQMSDSALNLI